MSGDAPTRLPPPGWYADPAGHPGSIRWWDGTRWTAAAAGPLPPPPTPLEPLEPAQPTPPPLEPPPPPTELTPELTPPTEPTPELTPPPELPPPTELTPPPEPARRIPARAAWWALLGLAVGEVAGGILGLIVAGATGTSTSSAAVTLAGEAGLWGGMLGACVLVVRRYGTGSLRRDLGLGWRYIDLAWGPLVTGVGLVSTGVLSRPFVGTRLAGSNTQLIDGQAHHPAGATVIALVVSIGAPVFEELFFRGLVRTALAARLGPIGAVLAQAGLFGLAHLNPTTGLGNIEVVVVIAGFGVVLGMAAHLSRRLAPGMIGHGLFNLLVTVSILTR